MTRFLPVFLSCLIASSCLEAVELPGKAFSELRSQEFQAREAAEAELLAWGRLQPQAAMTELLKQSRIADDPEVRERCLNVLRDLVTDEYMKDGEGCLGITMAAQNELANIPGDPKPCGAVRINDVADESAAERAGLKPNDLIVGLDGERWYEGAAAPAFTAKIRLKKPKTKVVLQVLRDGNLISVEAILGKLPTAVKNQQSRNFEASERADKEAFFRQWLSQKKSAE